MFLGGGGRLKTYKTTTGTSDMKYYFDKAAGFSMIDNSVTGAWVCVGEDNRAIRVLTSEAAAQEFTGATSAYFYEA